MTPDLWKYLGVALTAIAMLLGVGRYVGNLEQRLEQLEKSQRYLHGTIEVPRIIPPEVNP